MRSNRVWTQQSWLHFVLLVGSVTSTACGDGHSSDGDALTGASSGQSDASTPGAGATLGGTGNAIGGTGNGTTSLGGLASAGGGIGSGSSGSPGGTGGRPSTGGTSATDGSAGGSSGANAGATGGANGTTGGGAVPPSGSAAMRVDNPYVGAKGYVNPEWQAKANAEPGGSRISSTPTAVWLDRIAAIEGTANSVSNGPMGVRDHLDAALKQGAGYIQFVIYNLPGRDCSALASNGELGADELPRYRAEYIDPIVAIMADPAYRTLRIINVIEVDSLPNLITNTDVAKCVQMRDNGGYVQGISYALQKLGSLPNTYNYVDAGHHGWLGWDDNFNGSAQLFAQVGRAAGMSTVQGFITNTANYSALKEPFLDPNGTAGGKQLRESKWLDWNPYVDELSFAQAFRNKLVSLGFDAGIGMLIDTSRNGWGGSARPTAKSSASDLDGFVNQSRIDRRIHAGNWCNQSGAGLGERPQTNPANGIDAYVWIKPPGESDGASREISNNDGKGFDRMCDPTYGGNARNGSSATGALSDAPLSGAWFSAQFQELMKNAYPAL